MLIIQSINLQWNKNYRGAPYSTIRNNAANAYVLPEKYNEYSIYDLKAHRISLWQNKNGFQEQGNYILNILKKAKINIDDIELIQQVKNLDIYYKYSYNAGLPPRSFKNKLFKESFNPKRDSIDNLLVEKVTTLKSGDYVRIAYNGRHIGYDTGEWYYTKNIINILYSDKKVVANDILITETPTITYEQFATLY